MDKNKIAEFIKQKRKEQGLTQEQLAEKLYVTEKAISRWETGRGTPDISLLIPLSKELNVTTSELLNGKAKSKENINDVINYIELNKKSKYNFKLIISIICYIISILIFLTYLKIDYNTTINFNYFYRLLMIIISSIFILLGSSIINRNFIDKIEDKSKLKRISLLVLFIYYSVLVFNMAFFARTAQVNNYNLIPFKTIIEIIKSKDLYAITINIFGNLLVFMPINYTLMELFKIKRPLQNLITSFLIIFIIELIQYIFNLGVFDIDDIILCLSGMMIFYYIYNILNKEILRKKNARTK